MPDSMSIERRRLMLAYGATFDLTPREKGMKGSIARAQEIVAETPKFGYSSLKPVLRAIMMLPSISTFRVCEICKPIEVELRD